MEKQYFIKKLQYLSKEEAYTDLLAKGIIDENNNKSELTEAIVELHNDINFNIDLMLNQDILFENEIQPITPSHSFAGFEQNNIISDEISRHTKQDS